MGWPLKPEVLRALRKSRTIRSQAVHYNLITGTTTPLKILDGSVTVDRTAQCRRVLSLTVPNKAALFDALDTPGGEIVVTQGIVFATSTVWVPLGVFIVEQDNFTYNDDGSLTLTAPDRWRKVQTNNFGAMRSSIRSNAAWQEMQRLTEGAWPGTRYRFPGWTQLDKTATASVGSLLWDDGNRESAIRGIERANSRQVFFDPQGRGVLRPVPVLTNDSPYDWSVEANTPNANMTSAERSRDWSQVHNVIRIKPGSSDVVFNTVEVANTIPGDPLAIDGPLGYKVDEIEMAEARSSAQARAAGKTLLAQHLGLAKQLTLTGVSNPALDAEDVILVALPKINRTTKRPVEKHIIDSVVHPLVEGQDQQISTRSTRPDEDAA